MIGLVVPIGKWTYAVITLVYVAILAYGSIFIQSGFYVKTFCAGKTGKKYIALTFDDGPLKELTPAILDVLNEYQVKGTFFCIGNRIHGNEEIVQSIAKAGHIIGNHSYSHSNFFDFFTTRRVVKELAYTNEMIHKIIGKRPLFFRPPFGVTNPMVARAAKMLRLKVIGWNVRSMDGAVTDEDKVLKNVTGKLAPGAVILFHDSNAALPSILRKLFKHCEEQGYKFVPLDELLELNAYA